jgi:hypothetical protein
VDSAAADGDRGQPGDGRFAPDPDPSLTTVALDQARLAARNADPLSWLRDALHAFAAHWLPAEGRDRSRSRRGMARWRRRGSPRVRPGTRRPGVDLRYPRIGA